MNIYQNYTDLIGKTPLLRLKHIEKKYHTYAEIVAKLENFNPLSSVKDRLALALVQSLETSGQLKKNAVIIEPTSGNTVVGDDCILYHGVTLGANTFDKVDRHPKLGKGVIVYANETLIGPIKIGDYAIIGANSVVVKDAKPLARLKGVPAHRGIVEA